MNGRSITAYACECVYGGEMMEPKRVDTARALKATMRRSRPAGGLGEPDAMGARQGVLMYDIDVPWRGGPE